MRAALLGAVLAAAMTETTSNRASAPLCGEQAMRLGSPEKADERAPNSRTENATTDPADSNAQAHSRSCTLVPSIFIGGPQYW